MSEAEMKKWLAENLSIRINGERVSNGYGSYGNRITFNRVISSEYIYIQDKD